MAKKDVKNVLANPEHDKHPAEDALTQCFQECHGIDIGLVREARKRGLAWSYILELAVMFGPHFNDALNLLIGAWDCEPPREKGSAMPEQQPQSPPSQRPQQQPLKSPPAPQPAQKPPRQPAPPKNPPDKPHQPENAAGMNLGGRVEDSDDADVGKV